MDYHITHFNHSGNHINFGSGSEMEEEEDSKTKIAQYIALGYLICFASCILFCIIIICLEQCRKLIGINNHDSDRYSIYSYHSNFNNESLNSINKIRKMGKKTITDKISQYFTNIINPIYDSNLDRCAICLENIDPLNQDDEPCTLNCNHTYHKRCITEYVLFNPVNGSHINCPLCREDIQIV